MVGFGTPEQNAMRMLGCAILIRIYAQAGANRQRAGCASQVLVACAQTKSGTAVMSPAPSQSPENKKAHITVGFKDQAGTWVLLVAEARFELATFGL